MTEPHLAEENVDDLGTEQARRDLLDLDQRDRGQIVDVLLEAEHRVTAAVEAARDGIAEAVRLVEQALDGGGRLVYVGAGTPGRLAALDAAECPPTFGVPSDRVVAVLAGAGAPTAAVEGAEDRAEQAPEDLRAIGLGPTDTVVGITASGRTPYVLAALRTARQLGAATVAVVNNPGSPAAADVVVELLTGPEVIAGSTRLTAGTAQKITLNTLSTAAMVRLGRTYGPWMVDVVASNGKLRRRAERIIREACGVDAETAARTLAAADGHTKTAVVALLAGVDVEEARDRLARHDGRTRDAVAGP